MARMPKVRDAKPTLIEYDDLTVTLYEDSTAGIRKGLEVIMKVPPDVYFTIINLHLDKQYDQLHEYCKNYKAEQPNYKEEFFEEGFVRYEEKQTVFKYQQLVVVLFEDHVEANLFFDAKNIKEHEEMIRKLFIQHEYKALFDYCVANLF